MNTVKIAQKWRRQHDFTKKGGVIVVFHGEVQGWVNELRDPQHWQPGCIAVDVNGSEFIATGGDARDGAQRWEKPQSAA